jgi:hypothetical protein
VDTHQQQGSEQGERDDKQRGQGKKQRPRLPVRAFGQSGP